MRKFYFVVFLISFFASGVAQIDTSFWFVAPDISSGLGESPVKMYFTTYNASSTVYLRQPANATFTPVSKIIPANSIDSVDLTPFITAIESTPSNSVLPRGIYISASSNISVVYAIKAPSHKEMISLKGQKATGIDFYTPFQNQWRTAIPSSTTIPRSASAIDIVATKNNTSVLITPRANIIGHAKDVSFLVVLNAGETFSCQDTTTTAPTKLAGSIVSSDKPIAITVSSSNLLNGGGCNSTIADQITNSNFAGNDFVIAKSESGTDKVFILATVNSTSITVNNGTSTVSTLINTGETFSVNITQPLTYINTTKPVYALHASGYGCRLSGAQVPHFYCAGTYSTSFVRTTSDSFAVNVFTRNGFQGNFQLNGNSSLIPASAFTVVPGTSGTVVGARIQFNQTQVPVGSYNIITNSGDIYGMGTHQGSTNRGSAYAYHSEWISYPFVNAGPDGTICSNTTYTLNGQVGGGNVTGVWSTSGFGTFASGTTSLVNTYVPHPLDTTLKPLLLILTSTGPCTSRKDTLKLTVLQEPLVNASIDQIKCGNNATVSLNGSISGITNTGIWSSTGSGAFVPTNTLLTASYIPSSADTSAGFVNLILLSTNNGICLAKKDTMKITFTKPPLVNAGPTTMSICANNPNISLTGTVSGSSSTGKWTTSGTGIFNPNNISLSTNYLPSSNDITSTAINIYLISTNNGNCLPVKDSIQVYFTPSPNVNAGPDLFSCKNNSAVQLNGIIGGATTTGTWSGGGGVFSPSNSVLNSTYTPTSGEITAGFVVLNLTSTNNGNCIAVSDQVRIDFKDKPFANFTSNNVCLNLTTNFTDLSNPVAGTLASWNWNFGDGGNSSQINPTHTYTTAGTFTTQLIVKNSYNCYDTTRKQVIVHPLPNVNFSHIRSCIGYSLHVDFFDSSFVASPDTIKTYYWDFGGPGISTNINPSINYSFPNAYNVTHIVTTNHGCKNTIVKTVTIQPRPRAGFEFENNNGFSLGSAVAFTDTSKGATSWAWNFGDGNTSTAQNPYNIYYSNGFFLVVQVVKDQYGCTDTAKAFVKIINVSSEISELIPNAISPNGDSKNDIWRLDFINVFYPDAEIEIYNRWGERLFHSIGYSNAWDGSYRGDPLPVGTYYYIINLNDPKRDENIYKGTILLIK